MVEAFLPEVIEALAFYVYRLDDPRTDQTFYVGKGQGNRAFQHARLALKSEPGLKNDRIRELIESGLRPRIVIHRHGLSEAIALEIEAALIDAYISTKLGNEIRGVDSHRGAMSAEDVVEAYGAERAEIDVPAILIKIEQEWRKDLTPDQLYERTRRYWTCNPSRCKRAPTHAFAVARGIIREIYEVQSWETYDMSNVVLDVSRINRIRSEADRKGQVRRGFIGQVCQQSELRQNLIGKSIRHLPFGSGLPFAYANCD